MFLHLWHRGSIRFHEEEDLSPILSELFSSLASERISAEYDCILTADQVNSQMNYRPRPSRSVTMWFSAADITIRAQPQVDISWLMKWRMCFSMITRILPLCLMVIASGVKPILNWHP